ncbi:fhaA [Symbiodinium necroappetens]|uniref:FhaA protein n=1 Tax=Symbiodinium necroappetens TaxID=1628268 RepID=A0A813CQR9_9DINO|nr:fhaA [Symbiodinium necroappetens]
MQGATDVDVKLVYFKPDGTQKDIPIREGRHIVGRTDEAQLRIPLATVSRKHCELVFEGEKLVIRDLGSSNGTYINHERVQNAELGAGDVLGIGPCLLTVQINGLPANIEPPTDSSGESSLMETPPAGLDADDDSDNPLDNVAVDDLESSDPEETVTKTDMGSVLPNAAKDDSSIFDFDFDFEDDENPKL